MQTSWLLPTLALIATLFAIAPAPAQTGTSMPPAPRPPACSAPEHRQFDFWIGDWKVEDAQGNAAGTNRVERILDGCVLIENWKGSKGGEGKSFNLYNPTDRKWHQTWVDNSGSLLELSGGLVEGRMILSGMAPATGGVLALNRITWTRVDSNRVEQHWEVSGDNGTSWTTAFWGLYRRAGATPAGTAKKN